MARPNFLNENQNRTFPFLKHFQEEESISNPSSMSLDMRLLPNSAIVDFGATTGVLAFYEEENHVIYLYEVRRQGAQFLFTFKSTAPSLANKRLQFLRDVDSTDYETEYVDATGDVESSASLSESLCVEDPIWSAYLVTGTMEELAEILHSNGMVLVGEPDEAVIEPALVRSLEGAFARSINLANGDRTRAENADDCKQLQWPFTIQPLYINHECMIGPIRFKEGYNTVIDQDDVENSITIGATVGAGAGEPCEEVPLFPGEQPPAGEELLTGGPKCNDVIRSINGVGGKVLDILSGLGVIVQASPSQHEITVDIDMSNLAVCFDESVIEESCTDTVTPDPLCGPAE